MAEVKKQNWFKRTLSGIARYFRELKSELKKVVWPTPKQVLKNTLVVLACVIVVGVFIWLFDFVAKFGINALIDAVNQRSDADAGNKVEQPNEHADYQAAGADDQAVLSNLLGGGPNDLLQFAAKLTEVSGDRTEEALEPISLFSFCHVLRPPYLVSL